MHTGPAPAQGRDIVIGQVAPLSGVLADTGRDMVLGGKIYFDHVNAKGGINGRPIRHVVKDDGYEVEKTVALTQELLDKDKALALFGYAGTGNVGKLLQERILANANVAMVAPYTGGESLRQPFNPYIFHLRAGYTDETRVMVNYFLSNAMSRIAVMYQDDAFGKAGLAGVESALKERGLQAVALGAYPKNTDDVAQAVKTIADANPQAIVIVSVNKSSAAFIKQYRETGKKALMFNISVVNAQELARLIGSDAARGIGITQVVPSPFGSTLAVVKEYQALLKQYGPKDAKPSYTSFEEFLGAKVLVEGIRRSKTLSREGVMRALEGLNYDLGGFTVAYSATNRVGSSFVDITVVGHNGKLIH
ncbi:MAG TPA: ABC transporter substrate-binding protein [Ramlibacter sp.]|nr:ABC transporter substrate-binding protein [Ramlibacter sp.]